MTQPRARNHAVSGFYEAELTKISVLPGITVLSLVAWLLLGEIVSGWRSSAESAAWITGNRASVAIIVQIIAQLLGLLTLSTLRTTIDLSVRAHFASAELSIKLIKFVQALYHCGPDWTLPWPLNVPLVVYATLCLLPGALWAGAITPVAVPKATTKTLNLPVFSNTTWLHYGQNAYPPHIQTNYGSFTFTPEFQLQGLLLDAAGAASSRTKGQTFSNHTKLDKTGSVYIGRSYGAGASVGLVDGGFADKSMNYKFFESGLYANVSCIYNSTSAYTLTKTTQSTAWEFDIYSATGQLPNSGWINGYVAGRTSDQVVSIAAQTSATGSNYIGIATGNGKNGKYGALDRVQCQVVFTPWNFSVSVDTGTAGRNISVQPIELQSIPPWPQSSYDLISKSIHVTGALSSILGTATWTSVYGDVFLSNIANVEAAQGKSDASNLRGVADAFTSIIDNSLVSLSAAQLLIMNETIPVPAQANYKSVAFGTPTYVYTIVAINVVVCLVYFAEMARTRCWRGLMKFDFTNIGSVLVAASGGGTGLHEAACLSHQIAHGSAWQGTLDNAIIGKLRLWLDMDSGNNTPLLRLGKAESLLSSTGIALGLPGIARPGIRGNGRAT